MRHTFLISTAAAALVAGTVFAAAQSAPKQAPSSGAMERSAPSQGERGSDRSGAERPDQGEPRTTGQGEGKEPSKAPPRREGQSQPRTTGQGEGKQPSQAQPGREGAGDRREGAKEERSGKGSVSFTTEQRTKIRETVLRGSSAPRVTNVNFSIRVGIAVPGSVHVVTVPDVIVEYHPDWRGYYYFVYNDEIVILDKNRHIVAVIEV